MNQDKDDDLLKEARERFAHVINVDGDNRDNHRKDMQFVYSPGSQWPDDVKDKRKEWKELCLEFNQLKPFGFLLGDTMPPIGKNIFNFTRSKKGK